MSSPKKNLKDINLKKINLNIVDGIIKTEKYSIIGWNKSEEREINLEEIDFFISREEKETKND